MTTNGHNSDEAPEMITQQSDARESVRAGISSILGLEQAQGVGYSFNALQWVARMSDQPAEWMGMTQYTEREIQIQSMIDARRFRRRYGSSRLDIVDWYKALRRVSLDRRGRTEFGDMFIAERNRLGFQEKDQRNAMQRMLGTNRPREDAMKLNG